MTSQNKRFAQPRSEGGFALRGSHRKARGKRMARLLLKCGCCEQKLEVYYSPECLEINGVMASVENWRGILLPLLKPIGGEKRRRLNSEGAEKQNHA